MAPEMVSQRRDIAALAKGGRTNVAGFVMRLVARIPFLFIAGRMYGAEEVGRYALALVVVELAALVATLGLKRGLAEALASEERPANHIVADGMAVALVTSLVASALLFAFPQVMYPSVGITTVERNLPWIIFASALSDVALAALAYRHDVKASVTARAVVEPWTISGAALLFYYVHPADGLFLAYILSMLAALVASLVPLVRCYGIPRGWHPQIAPIYWLARRNAPLAGADALEWASRNIDRFVVGLLFAPKVVGIYYMAQQLSSIPQKLKTSFDPILGPVITSALARDDRAAIAAQVRQVSFWIVAAQGCLALMGSIPGAAVMGVVGPQFVEGAVPVGFLLAGEVFAANGAVCESALVYIARHLNLAISVAMLFIQAVLAFGLVFAARRFGLDQAWQAAGPAAALTIALAGTSIIKALVLNRLLQAPVSGWRWPLLWAAAVSTGLGTLIMLLPHELEWAQLLFGLPVIAGSYLAIVWRFAFRPADRALFDRPAAPVEVALPTEAVIS